MGNGQTDKHNRTAIGCDNRHQDARTDDHHHTGSTDVKTQVGCIAIAQQHQVHRLDKQETQGKQDAHQHHEEYHLIARNTRERTESPHDKRLHILIGCQELQYTDNSIGQITNHHTDNQ